MKYKKENSLKVLQLRMDELFSLECALNIPSFINKRSHDRNRVVTSCKRRCAKALKLYSNFLFKCVTFIFWLTRSMSVYLSSSYPRTRRRETGSAEEDPARAAAHLAVISLLNRSLIGALQRLITLTNSLLPTERPRKVSAWLRPTWLLSDDWVSGSFHRDTDTPTVCIDDCLYLHLSWFLHYLCSFPIKLLHILVYILVFLFLYDGGFGLLTKQ